MKALIDSDILIGSDGYPRRTGGYGKGSRFIHHYVMEEKLGRPLKKGEVVHHIDHDKGNNDPDNLMLCSSKKEHQIIHARDRIRINGGDPETDAWCTYHKCVHPRHEFSPRKDKWDGVHNMCRKATNEYRKEKGYYNQKRGGSVR